MGPEPFVVEINTEKGHYFKKKFFKENDSKIYLQKIHSTKQELQII